LDFAADGVYLAGLAHSRALSKRRWRKPIGRLSAPVTLLSRKELQSAPSSPPVNERLCAACGICVDVCPYSARVIDGGKGLRKVLEVLCQGCGACVGRLPEPRQLPARFD